MTIAKGTAMAPSQQGADIRFLSLRLIVVAGLSTIMLAACGGGAATTENPLVATTPTSGYNGPVATNSDIRKFQDELWSNISSSSRCGGCHETQTAQTPMFARNDDINLAYDAAITVVTLSSPQDSRLVSKVGGQLSAPLFSRISPASRSLAAAAVSLSATAPLHRSVN